MEQVTCGIVADTIQFSLAEAPADDGVLRVRAPGRSRVGAGALSIDDLFRDAGRLHLEVHGAGLRLRTADPS